METKQYKVLSQIRLHGKGNLSVGSIVDMAEPEARYLVLDGKVEVIKDTSIAAPKTSKTEKSDSK